VGKVLYNLRVIVEEVRGFCDLPMAPGDYFEVRGGRITIPAGKHMCLWAMSSLLPMLPAKQRNVLEENDWLPSTSHMCCPDPNGQVIFRIERISVDVSQTKTVLNDMAINNGNTVAYNSDTSELGSNQATANSQLLSQTPSGKPFPRILVNEKVCSGCRACELACSFMHKHIFSEAETRIRVEKDEPTGRDIPRVCRQCGVALCVETCPAGALSRDPRTKAIILNEELCTSCGACAKVCSFGAVHFHPDSGHPLFCDLCQGDPQCVERCTTGALTFGRAGEAPLKGGAKTPMLGGAHVVFC